jgi:hypothetical protein
MKSRGLVFNGILAALLFLGAAGCKTSEERKRAKQYSSLRVHLEADAANSDRSSAVSVHRSAPIRLSFEREAVLDESHVRAARVVDQGSGIFAIEIEFDRRGSWLLERTTVANKGRRLLVFSHFGETARWLAAPMITAKNSSGRLVFTPDASREEAERFVRGLNNVAKKLERRENWPFREPFDP